MLSAGGGDTGPWPPIAAVWSRLHALHDPSDREALMESALHRAAGDKTPFALGQEESWVENPRRVDALLTSLRSMQGVELQEAKHHELDESVLLVHDGEFVEWLRDFWAAWKEAGEPAQFGDGDAGLLPDTFRYNCCGGAGCSRPRRPSRGSDGLAAGKRPPAVLLNQAGWWCFDRNAPVVEHTFVAACAAVDTALTGAKLLLHEASAGCTQRRCTAAAFACCRPPGHHAGRQLCGGLCYFNNAAVAAQFLAKSGNDQRIAILDIDYHHGNGTQDIFYTRNDVFFASIHADPDYDFPYFSGRSDERGSGSGEGYNLNIPLAIDVNEKNRGQGVSESTYLHALQQALKAIGEYSPEYLIVSAGLDTFRGDQVGGFGLCVKSYTKIGKAIANLGLPTLLVQEGGYSLKHIGKCVKALLLPFVHRRSRD